MTREQRRAKQRKRNQRPHRRGSAIYVNVLELDGVSDAQVARSLLAYLGLPATSMLVAEERPVLAVFRSPGQINDCALVADGNRVLGMWHGTDCTLSTYIRRCSGKPLAALFKGHCGRRAAGGMFRVLDINEVRSS